MLRQDAAVPNGEHPEGEQPCCGRTLRSPTGNIRRGGTAMLRQDAAVPNGEHPKEGTTMLRQDAAVPDGEHPQWEWPCCDRALRSPMGNIRRGNDQEAVAGGCDFQRGTSEGETAVLYRNRCQRGGSCLAGKPKPGRQCPGPAELRFTGHIRRRRLCVDTGFAYRELWNRDNAFRLAKH